MDNPAARSGFRPCLRCRPETAPDLGAWRGTSNTVSRALALADLSALGMPKQRAVALSALAAAVLADPQIFGVGRNLEDAIVRLRALPGIGEWTAQHIAMRALREPDAFPATDIGLMRAMSDSDGRSPGARELLERAERWRALARLRGAPSVGFLGAVNGAK